MANDTEFLGRMQKIEALTREVEALPDENARETALELMRLLMEYHGAAIERVLEIVAAGDSSDLIFDNLAKDELSNSLLLLYGLHPLDFETRVEQALEQVRPYLRSHGGDAELLSVEDGVVRLRMIGSCNGCPSSSVTLKEAIEKAITEAAPDAVSIIAETGDEKPKTNGFVQIKGRHPTEAITDFRSQISNAL